MLSFLFAALLTQPATSSAQVTPRPGRAVLFGRVVDARGQPIDGADVTLLDLRAVTDGQGTFRLRDIPAGTHALAVRHMGHSPLMRRLAFASNDTLVQRLVLAGVAALDSVVVIGLRSGIPEFEEHRASGAGGRFITREQIDKYPTRPVADVLRPLPGLRISRGRGGRGDLYAINSRGIISTQGASSTCYVHVYLDGAPMYTGGMQQPYNLNSLSASDIAGIEYYQGASAVPPKYNRGAVCGVLVIWTRRQ